MGSTPTSVITIGFNGFPYLALVRAALSSPIREASLFTCNAITLWIHGGKLRQPHQEGDRPAKFAQECQLSEMPACVLHSTHAQIPAGRPTGSASTGHRQQGRCLKMCEAAVACKSYQWGG